MSDANELDRKDLDIIRDFNDAAEGLENRYDTTNFITAGDRLARKYGYLMASARTGTGTRRADGKHGGRARPFPPSQAF